MTKTKKYEFYHLIGKYGDYMKDLGWHESVENAGSARRGWGDPESILKAKEGISRTLHAIITTLESIEE